MTLVPIEPGRKFPRSRNWGSSGLEHEPEAVEFYEEHPDWGMGLLLSCGYCSLDIDCMESFRLICDEFGIDADTLPAEYPTIQGAQQGCRIIFRVPPGKDLQYAKLTWPTKENPAKQYTVFELRAATDGKQRQDVLPPTVHPDTGEPYRWLTQPPSDGFPLPPDWLISVWDAWDKFRPQFQDACPWAPKRSQSIPVKAPRSDEGGSSVISSYIEQVPLTNALESYGYRPVGTRYLSPHSSTNLPGVVLFEDGWSCWIHHASDPLCSDATGRPVNAFDLFAQYEHGGDPSVAVKHAARNLELSTGKEKGHSKSSNNGVNGTPVTTRGPSSYDFIDWPDKKPDKDKPLDTESNLRHLLDCYGITVRYNAITKAMEILIPGEQYTVDNQYNATLARIRDIASRHGLPTQSLPEYLLLIADRNRYNPVATWITQEPWDGIKRFDSLFDSLDISDSDQGDTFYRMLLYRWMVSAVHAVFNPRGLSAQGVLVFQGEQNRGKTKWLRSLTPDWFTEGLLLDPRDKDSVMLAVSHWIVELGELDATFRRADIAQLKAFITRDHDTVRKPYDRTFSELPRRTVFCGSVNDTSFLSDRTGNRRYWTILVRFCDWQHGLNMQQVWAEIYQGYKAGEPWYLAADEHEQLMTHNEQHEAPDPVRELLATHFDFASPSRPERLSSSEALRVIGYDKPTNAQAKQASEILRKLTGERPHKSKGRLVWRLPEPSHDHRRSSGSGL